MSGQTSVSAQANLRERRLHIRTAIGRRIACPLPWLLLAVQAVLGPYRKVRL